METINFNQSVISNTNYLRMFAMKLTKNYSDADDLYQETLYRAFKNSSKFLPGSNIKAWLTTIMKNSFINNYRRKKKEQIIPDEKLHSYILESNAGINNNNAISDINIQEINKVIGGLDDSLKTPFLMIWEGMKYEEVAEKLDLPLGTVKSRIFQARKELQHKIGKLFGINHSVEIREWS